MDLALHDCMSSGHCFWEKTSNGCKDEDDTFNHNAYDFYELCRAGKRKNAEFHCKEEPAKLGEGQCKDREEDAAKKGHTNKESSSGKADKDESKYLSYYYLHETAEMKFCYDCQQSKCMYCGFGSCLSAHVGRWRNASSCRARRGIFSA